MKLTKSKLKRLIKEEISNLDEGFFGGGGTNWDKHANTLMDIDQALRQATSDLGDADGKYGGKYQGAAKAALALSEVLGSLSEPLFLLADGEGDGPTDTGGGVQTLERQAPGHLAAYNDMIAAWKGRGAAPAAEEESVEVDVEEEV